MPESAEAIETFARKRLGTEVFAPQPDDPKWQIFHASLASAVEQFRWTSRASNESGTPFELHITFLETFSPNALADRFEGKFYLGVHVALFVAINEFAMFCFAQRDFFADVGDPKRETSPKPWDDRLPGIWLIDNTLHGGRVNDEHSRRLIPADPTRFACSQLLALLMARFVWLHELAHCFNGHVDLVQDLGIALRLNELPESLGLAGKPKYSKRALTTEKKDVLRCLELDADESAFFASCAVQMRDMENIEGIRELQPGVALRLAIFASYAMVWMFDAFQEYTKSSLGDTHPAPSLRLQNMLQTAKDRLASENGDFEETHRLVLGEFDPISKAIPGMFTFGTLREMGHSDELSAQLESLELIRQKVAEKLRQFQFSVKT